jgi:butyrate kinase
MRILAINPGSTSTKIAVFEDCKELFSSTLRHSVEELAPYESIAEQHEFRTDVIINLLREKDYRIRDFDIIVGRGGLVKPIAGGVYKVNDTMLYDMRNSPLGEHASNLGGIIANEFAKSVPKEIPSYIVNPVVVDEMEPLARYSGVPELPRISIFHALNQKAVARRYAREIGRPYEEISVVVVHLGGGITVGAHKNGKVIDVNNGLDGDGPLSPERAGSVPVGQLAKLCFSGKYQLHEIKKMITGKGGMVAYLGTNSAMEVEQEALKGNDKFSECYEAMAYQISKEIGGLATVLKGKVDAILITGGLAHSEILIDWIKERVGFICEVKVFPGEDEMQALAEGVFYATTGEIPIKEYV